MILAALFGLGLIGVAFALSSDVREEVIKDADGRPYRFRFVRENGSWKVYVVSMPWKRANWSHYSDHDIHMFKDRNELCLSTGEITDFDTAYKRTVLWANGFSFLMENGLAETKRVIPEW